MLLLKREEWISLGWEHSLNLSSIKAKDIFHHTRHINTSCFFFAFDGLTKSSLDYIDSVVQNEQVQAIFIDKKYKDILCLKYPNTCFLFAGLFRDTVYKTLQYLLPINFNMMNIVGITGTNGKTSICYLLYELFNQHNKISMYIGTLGILTSKNISSNFNLTTPDFFILYKFIHLAFIQNIFYIFLEVSSHALEQERLQNLPIDIAIFTNLTQDHLDYHKNFKNYFEAKKKLFFLPYNKNKSQICMFNIDDSYGLQLHKEVNIKKKSISIGTENNHHPNLWISNIQASLHGYDYTFEFNHSTIKLPTKLIGKFYAYNLAFAYLVAKQYGISENNIKKYLQHITIPGRMEKISSNKYHIFIDYAHTPHALESSLKSLKELSHSKLICVFGCGGNRDETKRSLMGDISYQLADEVIITNDNPRNEDPHHITDMIIKNFHHKKRYQIILDRKNAIHAAIKQASNNDIILIAGKGHETYQEINNKKIYFHDKECVETLLKTNDHN